MTVTASLDLWTILQGTKQLQRQNDLINLRIRQAGGVLKQDLEPFVFEILEDLETRIRKPSKAARYRLRNSGRSCTTS